MSSSSRLGGQSAAKRQRVDDASADVHPSPSSSTEDPAKEAALRQRLEKALRDRLRLLRSTDKKTHIISTPFDNQQGAQMARSVKAAHETSEEFCYNPNEDCPQTLDVSWLETWMQICNNSVRTGGTVFVMYRSDGGGRFGCEEQGPLSLDGQAQPGEVMHTVEKGARIEWVDYAPTGAAGTADHPVRSTAAAGAAAPPAAAQVSGSAPAATNYSKANALLYVCSPVGHHLAAAAREAEQVRACLKRAGQVAVVKHGGDGVALGTLLEQHRPRMLLFVGHADARHPFTPALTLGLTDAVGNLVRLQPETLADVLASAGEVGLELIVLNGCESLGLAEKVAARGVCAVCWSTKMLDTAGAVFSPAPRGPGPRPRLAELLVDALGDASPRRVPRLCASAPR